MESRGSDKPDVVRYYGKYETFNHDDFLDNIREFYPYADIERNEELIDEVFANGEHIGSYNSDELFGGWLFLPNGLTRYWYLSYYGKGAYRGKYIQADTPEEAIKKGRVGVDDLKEIKAEEYYQNA
jgi:hypothetical protein